jgi:hypothetical protein
MLSYALAIAVGVSSSILFVTAFLFKDIHRQDDFFWSGVGLFYALVLWFCATSITGAVLLGQFAVVALLTAYFWQMLKLRKAIAKPEVTPSLDKFSVVGFFQNLFKFKKSSPPASIAEVRPKTEPSVQVTTNNPQQEETPVNITSATPTVVTTTDTQPDSPSQVTPSSTTTTKETETKSDNQPEVATNPVATPSPTETSEEIKTPPAEVIESETETPEITVDTVTIVEEESNWEDEDVEDIPTSSIKVIKETPLTDEEKENKE